MTLWLLVVLWIGLAIFISKSASELALGFKPRLLTLLAAILILGSFLFQDWLRFDFIQYFRVGWYPLRELAPEAVGIAGLEGLSPFLRVLLGAASLNGWQLALVPFFGLGTRAALLFPSILAVAAFVWLPFGATYSGSRLCKVVGAMLATVSLCALVGLAAAIPQMDALGVHDQINWAILAVLLGVKLEMGPWLTMLGLALLIVGGLIEIVAGGPTGHSIELQEVAWP